jgi:hypothetical protein
MNDLKLVIKIGLLLVSEKGLKPRTLVRKFNLVPL